MPAAALRYNRREVPSVLRFFLPFCVSALLASAASVRNASGYVIPLPKGRSYPIAAQKGKVVLFVMLETTCRSCGATVELLTRLQREYADKGVRIVAAAVDESEQNVEAFVTRYRPPYPVGFLNPDQFYQFGDIKRTERPFVPILIFIDRNGIVREQYPGNHDYFKQLEPNLRRTLEAMIARK